jgi:hypothetical protein
VTESERDRERDGHLNMALPWHHSKESKKNCVHSSSVQLTH